MTFMHDSMQDILSLLQETLHTNNVIIFNVLDPDIGEGYAGNHIVIDNQTYIHRGYKTWTDLAELLMCKMCTPKEGEYPFVTLRFEKLETQNSFHLDTESPKEEKYGVNSHFSQINKMEEPAFLYYYQQALKNARLNEKTRILNLGINTGDEFSVIKNSIFSDADASLHAKDQILFITVPMQHPGVMKLVPPDLGAGFIKRILVFDGHNRIPVPLGPGIKIKGQRQYPYHGV